MNKDTYKKVADEIAQEIKNILDAIDGEQVLTLIDAIKKADKVFFVGVGRVMLSLEGMAKRFNHLGIKCFVVGQITEPAITEKDLLIVGSGSGESAYPLVIAAKAKKYGAQIAHIGSNPNSSMKEYTDVFVRIPVRTKCYLPDELPSVQPMTTIFDQCLLVLGDTIALMLIQEDNIDMKNLWEFHANLE